MSGRWLRRSVIGTLAVALPLAAAPPALAARARPTGTVFLPNPVVALRGASLADDHDADSPAFADAYRVVRIRKLDHSGYLRGAFADACPASGNCAFERKERYRYDRSDDRFEQVMAYYAVTKAGRYLRLLGFRTINRRPQEVLVRGGADNSYFDAGKDRILLGSGGVDDGEDMEVIWHEYAHSIQVDQVPGFGTSPEARALGEGWGDYWAYTMSEPLSDGFDPACIADWDSVPYTDPPHCLRRVDTDLTVADMTGQPHHDGQIWSRALYDIHGLLGRESADRLILTAQWSFVPDTTFAAAAASVVETATDLHGTVVSRDVEGAFEDRGIL